MNIARFAWAFQPRPSSIETGKARPPSSQMSMSIVQTELTIYCIINYLLRIAFDASIVMSLAFGGKPLLAEVMKQMTLGILKAHAASPSFDTSLKTASKKPRFYSFYSLDEHGHIIAGEDMECENDATAMDRGWDLLAFGECPTIEVWVRNARVGLVGADCHG
jgi:hypothetical protein